MPFRSQKILDRGTETPAVARTVQWGRIFGAYGIRDEREQVLTASLHELMLRLVRCLDVADEVRAQQDQGIEQARALAEQGKYDQLPSVVGLTNLAESFLQSSKLAIREASSLVRPFHPEWDFGHRFDKAGDWSADRFGSEAPLTRLVRYCEPFIGQVVGMRNAVDHKSDDRKLEVANFRVSEDGELELPAWRLTGGDHSPILQDMDVIAENILVLSEDLLVVCLSEVETIVPLVIRLIPLEDRDPKFPERFRVDLATPADFGR